MNDDATDKLSAGFLPVNLEEANSHFDMVTPESGNQQSLFAAGELLAPLGLTKFRKGIAILHSVPVSRDKVHTLNSHRLMDAIVALVQMEFKRRPRHQVEAMREMEASPLFRTTKLELRRLVRIPDGSKHLVEDALALLHDMPLQWNVLGEDAEVEWHMRSHFLASYGIGKGRYKDQVCFSIDPRVLNLILEPKLWVTVHVNIQERLNTETSYSLYQQAWRYIGTTHKVTADFPLETWIDLISGPTRFVQVDETTKMKYVVDYPEWKRRHLVPAIERINRISALAHKLELIEMRSGRKVSRLQFRFVPKNQFILELPIAWDESVVRTLKDLGFVDNEIAELSQGFSQQEVAEAFLRYQHAKKRQEDNGKRINAPKAFFNAILTNVSTEGTLDDTELEKLARRAREEEAARRAQEQELNVKHEFSKWQADRLKNSLQQWPADRREGLLREFENSAGAAVKTLLKKKGESQTPSYGLLSMLAGWLQKARSEDWEDLMPNPEDRQLSAWLMWKVTSAKVVDAQ